MTFAERFENWMVERFVPSYKGETWRDAALESVDWDADKFEMLLSRLMMKYAVIDVVGEEDLPF